MTAAPTDDTDGSGARWRFRGDVEGLRAVAIGGVLAYHAGIGRFSGGYVGVDVFFVISGFLITGLLVRELTERGTISLLAFYGRRVRRLLPLTVVALAAVAVLAWLFLSPVDRASVSADVIAAGLYVINWRLSAQAVDYSALGAAASPVQHFWSLAVEEQFYLVWPLVLLAVAWWCQRRGGTLRPALSVVVGVIAAASLAYSVYLTRQEGDGAYFSTFVRGWELAAGGLLALLPLDRLRWPRRLPGLVAAAGIAAVLASMLLFTDDTAFPGAWALLPVLGAVAVIAGGSAPRGTAVSGALDLPPVRYVGRISYSWYVWHWPAVVFATAWLGALPTRRMVVVVLASAVPAVLTHRLVEVRFRQVRWFAPPRRALRLGVACMAASVLVGVVSLVAVPTVPEAPAGDAVGARALESDTGPQKSATHLRPTPDKATNDKGQMYDDGCLLDQRDTRSPSCTYGDTSSDTTVVLFGDSHAMQYSPALITIAKRNGWRLVGLTKSYCSPAEVQIYDPELKREYSECDTWRQRALRRIERTRPALVITGNLDTETVMESGHRLDQHDSAAAMMRGYAATLRILKRSATHVATLTDNPHPPEDVPSCVSTALNDLTRCAFSERVGLHYHEVSKLATEHDSAVRTIHTETAMCFRGICPAVIGNVIVYRNGTHITATYMNTLTDWLQRQLPDVT